MQRETWTNTLTYVLTVAGATIGFGATWRFPYLVGENGGGAYVLIFCIAMIVIGIPVILVENVIGRRMMKNSIDDFGGETSGKKKISSLWKIVGYMGLLGSFGIMAYYVVIGGWVFTYVASIIGGTFDVSHPVNAKYTSDFYHSYIENNPLTIGFWTLVFVGINWYILRKGIIGGIEKYVRFLMPVLLICLVVVVVRNITLPNSEEGILFYLTPDISKINSKLFIDVLGQVFFALSLGFGVMITLSSHLNQKENLMKTAVYTSVLNTIIAVLAGFMIFPALFSAGLQPDVGPSLVFKTLPIAFSHIPFGNVILVIFFLLLLVAALTTSLPIYQVIISVLEEKFNFSKKLSINLTLVAIFILGNIPSILTYGPWSEIRILGRNIFDTFDFVSGNILFVLTALGACIYVGWVLKKDAVLEISNQGKIRSKLIPIWYFYIKYIVPLVILVIFVSGIRS